MKNTKFSIGLLSVGSLFSSVAGHAQSKSQQSSPNVLLVVVDDWGINDLSANGSKLYETPNLDRLISQSTSFSNAYNAYPRSVPSRFSLWTGMHCARPQEGSNGGDDRKIYQHTYAVPEAFQQAGYTTFFIGKWHLASDNSFPQDHGFDVNIGGGHAGSTSSHFAPFNQKSKSEETHILNMDDAVPGEYLTDYMTRKTVDYIKAKKDKPFFAACAFYAVHTPLEAKKELIEKYEKKRAALGYIEEAFITEEAGVRKVNQDNAVYAAMIESVDQAIGQMVDALKKSNQYENTIIVVVSDNGGLSNRGKGNNRELATTNAPYKAGKGHLYEGGIRTPLVVKMNGQQVGATSDLRVVNFDILPTLADVCNAPIKKGVVLDGKSFKSILLGKKAEATLLNRNLYWHKVSERPGQTGDYNGSAIISGDYKLLDFTAQNRIELYNLKTDPYEAVNLLTSEPQKAKELLGKLNEWKSETKVYTETKAKGPKKDKGKAGKKNK